MEESVTSMGIDCGLITWLKAFFQRKNPISNVITQVEYFSFEPLPFTDSSLFEELCGLFALIPFWIKIRVHINIVYNFVVICRKNVYIFVENRRNGFYTCHRQVL